MASRKRHELVNRNVREASRRLWREPKAVATLAAHSVLGEPRQRHAVSCSTRNARSDDGPRVAPALARMLVTLKRAQPLRCGAQLPTRGIDTVPQVMGGLLSRGDGASHCGVERLKSHDPYQRTRMESCC